MNTSYLKLFSVLTGSPVDSGQRGEGSTAIEPEAKTGHTGKTVKLDDSANAVGTPELSRKGECRLSQRRQDDGGGSQGIVILIARRNRDIGLNLRWIHQRYGSDETRRVIERQHNRIRRVGHQRRGSLEIRSARNRLPENRHPAQRLVTG